MREFVSDDLFIEVSFNSASTVIDYDSSMTKHTGNGNADKGNAIQKMKLYLMILVCFFSRIHSNDYNI